MAAQSAAPRRKSRRPKAHYRWGPAATSLIISIVVVAACLIARRQPLLQGIELRAYDWLVNHSHRDAPPAAPILVIAVDEGDIQQYLKDYPVSDEHLAELLERILVDKPRAVGVDIYRDTPVIGSDDPKQQGPAHLAGIIAHNRNLIWIVKVTGDRVGPPAVLRADSQRQIPLRVGFSDAFKDEDGIVRRAALRTTEGSQDFLSLDVQLARLYLRGDGTRLQLDADSMGFKKPDGSMIAISPLAPDAGAYVNQTDKGTQEMIDYSGPAQFKRIDLRQAMGGDLKPEDVAGGVVLVGVSAASIKDVFSTPLQTLRSDKTWSTVEPGVVYHARVVDQLIRQVQGQAPMAVWSKSKEMQWILLWGVLGGLVGFAIRAPAQFALAVLIGLAILVMISISDFNSRLWIPTIPPAGCFAVSAGLVTSFLVYVERRDRSALMQLFCRHVSSDVAQTIWEQRDDFFQGGRMKAMKVQATVLFTDLRGFTTLSENLDPAVLMDFTNEFMERMSGIVESAGGMINKYIGDSIMAVFGVPVPSDTPDGTAEDARQAVRCALAMRKELAVLNAAWEKRNLPQLQMRVGIYSGLLVAGSLGSSQRLEYTVLGDTVNTASRLESYDKEVMADDIAANGCRILIGQPTMELIGPSFITRPLGELHLKGKQGLTVIYGVIAERAEASKMDPAAYTSKV